MNRSSESNSSSDCWKLVLLVDFCELSNSKWHSTDAHLRQIDQAVKAATHSANIVGLDGHSWCELGNHRFGLKKLPVGDYMVVARRMSQNTVLEERVLSIIERKSGQDLDFSLKTMCKSAEAKPLTRMERQIWLMKNCCSSDDVEKIVILEGTLLGWHRMQKDVKRMHVFKKQIETWDGFRKAETKNVEDTQHFLVHHLKILFEKIASPINMKRIRTNNPTFEELKQLCSDIFQDKNFRFYIALRNINGVGDNTAITLMEAFPEPKELERNLRVNRKELFQSIKTQGGKAMSGTTISNLVKSFRAPVGASREIISEFVSPSLSLDGHNRKQSQPAVVTPSPKKRKDSVACAPSSPPPTKKLRAQRKLCE